MTEGVQNQERPHSEGEKAATLGIRSNAGQRRRGYKAGVWSNGIFRLYCSLIPYNQVHVVALLQRFNCFGQMQVTVYDLRWRLTHIGTANLSHGLA